MGFAIGSRGACRPDRGEVALAGWVSVRCELVGTQILQLAFRGGDDRKS